MKQGKQQKRVQRIPEELKESLSYTVEVRDKEGRVIQRISAPSRSYVQQWNQLVNVHASQVNKTVKDIDGVDRTVKTYSSTLLANAPISNVDYGLRVGKGTTAVAITDYALETPCGEGTGTDEFNHQLVEFTEPSVAGSTCSFEIVRTMINNSGAAISVGEIGCYIIAWEDGGGSESFLGFRDVLPSAVDIPDGGSITVTYTIAVTV